MINNKNPRISIIAAIGHKNRVLANANGQIPWHISEDFKYFKEKTMNHPIIMGRKTFETFPKPLPDRTHIVISRSKENYKPPAGVISAHSIEEAILKASNLDKEEIFVIGGGQIYNLALNFANKLYLTLVETEIEGPIKFPEYSEIFNKVVSSRKSSDENFKYEFVVLEKEII